MLKKLRELLAESAKVCVLRDAVCETELQSVAYKHFNPDQHTQQNPNLSLPSVEDVAHCTQDGVSTSRQVATAAEVQAATSIQVRCTFSIISSKSCFFFRFSGSRNDSCLH